MIPNGCLLTHSLAYLPEATGKCKPVSFLHCNRPKSPRHDVLSSGVSKAPPQPLFGKSLPSGDFKPSHWKLGTTTCKWPQWPFGPCSDPTPSPGSHGFCWRKSPFHWLTEGYPCCSNSMLFFVPPVWISKPAKVIKKIHGHCSQQQNERMGTNPTPFFKLEALGKPQKGKQKHI